MGFGEVVLLALELEIAEALADPITFFFFRTFSLLDESLMSPPDKEEDELEIGLAVGVLGDFLGEFETCDVEWAVGDVERDPCLGFLL